MAAVKLGPAFDVSPVVPVVPRYSLNVEVLAAVDVHVPITVKRKKAPICSVLVGKVSGAEIIVLVVLMAADAAVVDDCRSGHQSFPDAFLVNACDRPSNPSNPKPDAGDAKLPGAPSIIVRRLALAIYSPSHSVMTF